MSRLLKRAAAALCVLCLLGLTLPAFAAPAPTVRVGFFAMDGYHVEDENGARSGYGYDFLHLLARYSNLRFTYVGYDKSWAEMQKMLDDGEIDLLTSMQKTPEREEAYGFSDTLIGTSTAILTVKAGDSRFADGNYNNMRIGLVKENSRNSQLDRFMAENGFTYTPVYYSNMYDLTAALQEGGRIDAALTSNLRRINNEWILTQFESSPFYAVVRKDNTALLSEINAAIDRMDQNAPGWRTRLMNKYYSTDSSELVAFSGEEREYLAEFAKSGRVLRVTMHPDNAPYSYFENGKPRGIIYDIFTQVAARMGVPFEMVEPDSREAYQKLCTQGGVDVILDAMDDAYTAEQNGAEITEAYYSTPMAVLTTKASVGEVRHFAQPAVSILNETFFAHIYDGHAVVEKRFASNADAAACVRRGGADGVYMPYYCAQWLSGADATGKLHCLMTPMYERSFVYAVGSEEDYALLSSLGKAADSLSEDYIASIVASNTERTDEGFSIIGLLYENPVLFIAITVLLAALSLMVVLLIYRNKSARKELRRSHRLERYIGYLCDIHDKVLEVDFDLRTRRQYRKCGGAIQIEERDDFTAFDFARFHPDDTADLLSVFSPTAVRALFASGEDERYIESRMKSERDEYRWYSFLLKLIPRDKEHPCSAMLLIKDIDDIHREREHASSALHEALDAANAASRTKSTFLSSMSHEIRTPLNAVIGYMTIAATAIDNRDKVLHCIDSAGIAARHLLSIINDVLDISSLESGKMKLAHERFDLKEQVSAVSTVFYQQCKQKNITFSISVHGLTEEWVIGDAMRINQILINLMSNAVKFTAKGGVSLTVAQTAQTTEQVFIRFTVRDSGIGMAADYLDRLFAPFEQESAQTARHYGGTGLGMPITRNLVSLMGGTIDVQSEQGVGTVFTVTIPFGRTDNSHLKAAMTDFSHLHVLAVDDLENERDYIRALLDRCGIHAEVATGGEEAVRLVAARLGTPEHFDLCIIDWNMPGMNGVDTTRRIHDECDPNIPVIIATAYDISEFEALSREAGAARIVSKPLFQSTLLDLLVTTYGRYEPALPDEDGIPDLDGMCVLLAEDNETNVEVARDLLELAGVRTEVAVNGREAVDMFLAQGERYDAVLMDVQMPVMDGYAACRAIRASAHPCAETIPIIALTADAFAENVAAALAAGMNDHIAKPIETPVLFEVLRKIYRK